MYINLLSRLGLSKEQSQIYELLVKNGLMNARRISLKTGIKRGFVYKTLDQLVLMGLINKLDNISKISIFSPNHPSKLVDIIENKRNENNLLLEELNNNIGNLISDYNFISGKPNVRFYEGEKGVEELYSDINADQKDILLIRSPYDVKVDSLKKIVKEQINTQVLKNIHTKAITPVWKEDLYKIIENDPKNLVERCAIPQEKLTLPAQIIIYGEKVAITSLKEKVVTTIIENSDISDAFRVIFNYIWNSSKEKSNQIIEESINNKPLETGL